MSPGMMRRSPFWLALAATMPLTYLAPGPPGPWLLAATFGPPLLLAAGTALLASRRA